jgi:adenosylmethionine-8-amino-7-oxononanoate aminotransferase
MLAFACSQPLKIKRFTSMAYVSPIWHPCSQMKDYETFPPLEVISAEGCYLELKNGKKILDAISSWWCKSLGHQHPRLRAALARQMEKFEHVLLVNTTNDIILELSEKLARLTSTLNKVSYAADGSCAVEMAMKMSLHARQIQGEFQRTQFMALENGYHGETVGAMSVSDLGLYRAPYAKLCFEVQFLSPLPYVSTQKVTSWENCQVEWDRIEPQLNAHAETLTAIIVEPIVQGACGMKIYSQDFLRRLRAWTEAHGIHLIADEIMTGLGRTGKMLACQHAGIEPDILCLSKGLTAGWLPLSAVLTHQGIYNLFYNDYELGKNFLHSHTYSGNPLAASIAIEVLNIIEEEQLCARANEMSAVMYQNMLDISSETGVLTNIRSIGAIAAADLLCKPERRAGYEIYQKAVALGILLRPLGNTLYWLPPLNADDQVLSRLKEVTTQALDGYNP